MRKYTLVLSVLMLMAVLAGSVAAQDATPAVTPGAESLITNVCLVTDTGKINDGTFNQYAYEGMQKAADDFGLSSDYIETQAQADYANNIDTCINSNYEAIVTVGFLIQDATYAAAVAHPDRYFIGVDQFYTDPLPNLVGIQYREDQGGFLVGALAALMTKSNVIAGVYGKEIPPVIKYRNGYEQGARYINPDIQTLGAYIDSFNAPDRGQALAEQEIGQGADVIFGAGGPTGSGGTLYAAQHNTLVIGVDQDEYFTTYGSGQTPGAENLISSAQKRVDVGVYDMIQTLVNGQGFPDASLFVLDVNNDGINFAPPHDSTVPQTVTDRLNEILAGLKDGTIETGVDPNSGLLLSEETPVPTMEATASS